jgi:pikromycin synthase
VEEALRLESPFTGFWRRARRAAALAGGALPAGALLLVPFGALNRDPAAFPEPGRADLGRPAPRRHLAFGHGIHFCVGAPLARLEAAVALQRLLPRLERVELLADPAELLYRPSIQGRGLAILPVRLVARPAP